MNDPIDFFLKHFLVFSILSVIIVNCLKWYYNKQLNYKPYKLPPLFPGYLPIIGHTLIILKHGRDIWGLYRHVMDYMIQNGRNIITFRWGKFLGYILMHPEDSYRIANKCLEKHDSYKIGKAWFGEGLITGKASTWKVHRKLLSPAMSQQVVNGFMDLFNEQSMRLVNALKDKVGKGPFDHFPTVRRVRITGVCSTIMGYTNSETTEELYLQFVELFDLVLNSIMDRARRPWLLNEFIFKLSGLKKQQDEMAVSFNKLIDRIIYDKEREMQFKTKENTTTNCKFFLDFLLELKFRNMLTHQDVKDEIFTMIFAAYDTSSLSIAQTILVLGSYPEIQDKIFEELQEIFGGSNRDITKEDLSRMKYLEAAVKESLRLYPTVPMVIRKTDQDVKIGEYTLRSGGGIAISLYDINRHPESWGPGADVFDPERWLDPSTVPEKAFASFSLGRRNCIGKYYAMVNLKTTLAYLFRRYKITADVSKVKYEIIVNLNPLSGHHIVLEER